MHVRLCHYSGLCGQNRRQNKVTISGEVDLKTAVDKRACKGINTVWQLITTELSVQTAPQRHP